MADDDEALGVQGQEAHAHGLVQAMAKKTPDSVRRLNHKYRNGGNLPEREERQRDMIEDFNRLRERPCELGAALEWMGIFECGDDP